MISVSQAKALILNHTSLLEAVVTDLYEANGLVIGEDLYSQVDVPPFDQSAMDGYGFHFSDLNNTQTLKLEGEIPAGVFYPHAIPSHTAIRIYTGAAVPENCDTIVMQEKVEIKNDQVVIKDPHVKKGLNIRLKGTQTKKGELAMQKGLKLSAGAIGYLAGLGFQAVAAHPKPNVCIINTGKELTKPGHPLEPGKVYECNSYSLNAALNDLHIQAQSSFMVDDNEAATIQLISENIGNCDVMILSGGVSVGDYDYVASSLAACGVETIFHKVKQKPGKPMYFGKKGKTLMFGLPGNPAALLTCYYAYIVPAIKKMMGQESEESKTVMMPLSEGFVKKSGLTYLLKGKVFGKEVSPLNSQESYLMNSFAAADCIIHLEEEKTDYKKGELVEVHFIDQ